MKPYVHKTAPINQERLKRMQREMDSHQMYLDKEIAPGSGQPDYFDIDQDAAYQAHCEQLLGEKNE